MLKTHVLLLSILPPQTSSLCLTWTWTTHQVLISPPLVNPYQPASVSTNHVPVFED